MLWVTDVAASLVHIRPEWETLTGQKPAEALGDGWVAKVHPDDQALVLDALRRATRRQEAFVVQHRLKQNVGGYHWVMSGGAPSISPETGKFLGYLGTLDVIAGAGRQASAAIGALALPAEGLETTLPSDIDTIADQVIYARELAYQAKETGILAILDIALAEIGFRIAQGNRTAALLETLKARLL